MSRACLHLTLASAMMALPSFALAQTASLGERTLTEGLILPPESAATVDDAASGTLNPAGIGLMQGTQLEYWHERELLNAGSLVADGLYGASTLFDVLAAGLSFEWVRPDQGPNLTKTHLSLALSPDRSFSIGMAYNFFGSSDPLIGSLTSWDAGLTWRPIKYASLAASARDFDNPQLSTTGIHAPRRFDFALGLHPFGPMFSLAGDYLFLTDGPGSAYNGAGNGRVGITGQLALPFGVGVLAGAAIPVGTNQNAYGQIALSVSTEHVGAAISYAPSAMGSALDLGAFDVGLRLSTEVFQTVPPPGARVVEIDLAALLAPKSSALSALFSEDNSDPFERILHAIADLNEAPVRAVIFRLGELSGLSLGRVEELRSAIAELRAHRKTVIAYLGGGGDATYYLAAACDRIYAIPQSDFSLHGFSASSIYFAEGLTKIGVRVDVARVGPYKSATDEFTRDEPSPEQTEITRSLLNDSMGRYLGAVKAARGVSDEAFKTVLDRGLSTAEQLASAGLVDGVIYPDEMGRTLGKLIHSTVFAEDLDLTRDYHQLAWSNLPGIAVVNVFGLITGGESQSGTFGLARTAGEETIVRNLRAAGNDYTVDAVVVRVDSGGGDGAASELIWRAIGELRRKKPVVVSFGDVAASGGYYLAVSADEILAEPSTITGSIGVFAIKPDLSGLAQKLGIHPHEEALTPNATLFSLATPWTESERAVVQSYIDSFYATFVKRVADGRHLSEAQVETIGRGRVWSGSQAKERGLVDGLGSFTDAVAHAMARAHLAPDEKIRLVTYNDKGSTLNFAALGAALSANSGQAQISDALRTLIQETGAAPALLLPRSSALAMPEALPQYQ